MELEAYERVTYPKRAVDFLKTNLADSVAGISSLSPLVSFIETYINGMEDEVSLKSKFGGFVVSFGLMPAIMGGRKYFQRAFSRLLFALRGFSEEG